MKEDGIMNGHIVDIDYIEESTKKHIKKGLAVVLYRGFGGQPLVVYLSDLEKGKYIPRWECYEHFKTIYGYIDMEKWSKDGLKRKENE